MFDEEMTRMRDKLASLVFKAALMFQNCRCPAEYKTIFHTFKSVKVVKKKRDLFKIVSLFLFFFFFLSL